MAGGGGKKIGLALDFSKSSKAALRWATDNLIRKGDTILLLHIMPDKGDEAKHPLWIQSGSRTRALAIRHPASL
ncbi:hypothetical protein BHE74_00045521 [Ensete ventricosum]|uniref:Uncharacterized protein n=1 Tax=Ensete ventricosum TaxID=4639 RepID=A0A426ZP29_ENSVE|nr:hypothetical protein B296_00040809 [Ensete ventricosum]RWW14120.1 hypothetical protein GW17_00022133 [Ensete ventricosum]RWW48403.1 hypothetical protein BHE74_00045521 [Ensete ventricosum]RZS17453.1 hypothetical protein BHM03_00049593 [Ensete ventricosum]